MSKIELPFYIIMCSFQRLENELAWSLEKKQGLQKLTTCFHTLAVSITVSIAKTNITSLEYEHIVSVIER